MKLLTALFLIAFICANLLVKHFGAYGLWISSALLIPFDFVTRCVIHEKLKGSRLIIMLFGLTLLAASITMIINADAYNVAMGSVFGFTAAQIAAGIFYQWRKANNDSYFIKVNISDLIAITFDSIVFQLIAFNHFNILVMLGQVAIKFAGGLFWYWIIFVKLKRFMQTNNLLPRIPYPKSFFQQQLEKDNELFLTKFKQNEK